MGSVKKKSMLITMGDSFTEGIGCYNYEAVGLPSDYYKPITFDLYSASISEFHTKGWPPLLQNILGYDILLNMGLGGSSNSGSMKIFIDKIYNLNILEEYDVTLIWMFTHPYRYSLYHNGNVLNMSPAADYSDSPRLDNLKKAYIEFFDDLEGDTSLETVFLIKTLSILCKGKCNFLTGTFFHSENIENIFPHLTNSDFFIHNHIGEIKPVCSDCGKFYCTDHPGRVSAHCGHPNHLGYKMIAEKLADVIKKNFNEFIPAKNSIIENRISIYCGRPDQKITL
jgi:hypothetical protein